jgi:hypothetical protein
MSGHLVIVPRPGGCHVTTSGDPTRALCGADLTGAVDFWRFPPLMGGPTAIERCAPCWREAHARWDRARAAADGVREPGREREESRD